jgi:hypothetical protein
MLKSQTTTTITQVDSFYCNWSDGLEISLSNGDKVMMPLTLEQFKDLQRCLGQRIDTLEKRQLEKLREQLEEADAANADS